MGGAGLGAGALEAAELLHLALHLVPGRQLVLVAAVGPDAGAQHMSGAASRMSVAMVCDGVQPSVGRSVKKNMGAQLVRASKKDVLIFQYEAAR